MDILESNREFFNLLENPQIQYSLKSDKCMVIMDKYILAAIILFFRRAKFKKSEYNCENFYVTLYLLHDLYEEVTNFKEIIINDCLGAKIDNKYFYEQFLQARFKLLQRMNYNGHICMYQCREIMKSAPHNVWNRTRRSQHSGAFYKTFFCKFCLS